MAAAAAAAAAAAPSTTALSPPATALPPMTPPPPPATTTPSATAEARVEAVAERIAAAFGGVTLVTRPGRGRCLVATAPLAAGTVVLRSVATAFVVTDASRCSYCVFGVADATCTACRSVRYCSKECQRADWSRRHKAECKTLAPARAAAEAVAGGGGADACFADALLLARTLRDGAAPPRARGVTAALTASPADIAAMEAPPPAADPGAWANAAAVCRVAGTLGAPTTGTTPAAAAARRLAAAFPRNNFAVADELMTARGAAVFPLGALLNHDCAPSAMLAYTVVDGALVQTIRTLRPVAAGDELTHSYVEIALPSAARRGELADTYGFACTCSLCVPPPAAPAAVRVRDAALLGVAGDAASPALPLTACATQPALAPLLGSGVPPLAPLDALLARGARTAADDTQLWQYASVAAEHARGAATTLARIYLALGVASPPPVPLTGVPSTAAPAAADDDVATEVRHAEAALAALRGRLQPTHIDAVAGVNVLFARALLRGDTAVAALAAAALVAFYRVAYAATPAHPMLALQRFTCGDLCGELAAARGGVPRTCTRDPAVPAGRVATLATLFGASADVDADVAAWYAPCSECCCTWHHWQRVALTARVAHYRAAAASLAIAYGSDSELAVMAAERLRDASSHVADFTTYGGVLCAAATAVHVGVPAVVEPRVVTGVAVDTVTAAAGEPGGESSTESRTDAADSCAPAVTTVTAART